MSASNIQPIVPKWQLKEKQEHQNKVLCSDRPQRFQNISENTSMYHIYLNIWPSSQQTSRRVNIQNMINFVHNKVTPIFQINLEKLQNNTEGTVNKCGDSWKVLS